MVISFSGEASTAFFSLAGAFLDLLLRGLTLRDHMAVGWMSGFLGLSCTGHSYGFAGLARGVTT